MKNYLAKFSIFFITLSLGLLFVFGLNLFTDTPTKKVKSINNSKIKQTQIDKKVSVVYKGFSTETDEIKVNFEIINLTGQDVLYQSYEERGSLFHYVKLNGKELSAFRCGTGLQEFTLAPNDSLIIEKSASNLFLGGNFTQNDVYEVSFFLKENEGDYKKYSSEEFKIPSSIVKSQN